MDPEDDGAHEGMESHEHELAKAEAAIGADENVSPNATRADAPRGKIEEDVEVEVEIARSDVGVHATTRGVQKAVLGS